MGNYGIMMIISGVINAVLGGGLIITLRTLKSKTKEAEANAKMAGANADSIEIRNVGDITKLLIESTSEFEKKLDGYRKKLDEQDLDLRSMKNVLGQIKHLIEQLTEENVTDIANRIKDLTNVVKS